MGYPEVGPVPLYLGEDYSSLRTQRLPIPRKCPNGAPPVNARKQGAMAKVEAQAGERLAQHEQQNREGQ